MPTAPPHAYRDNHILAALSPEALTLVESELKRVEIERGAVLHEPGDEIESIYFPLSGMISLLVVTENGDSIETATVGREGAIGMNSGFGTRYALARATILVEGVFGKLGSAAFRRIVAADPGLANMIFNYTEIRLAESQQLAACNIVHNTSARLCRWLLQTVDRLENDHVALTQEFMAQMLGVRRTTVTLQAQIMQSKGMITYTRGKIRMIDREAVEECACECYEAMKHARIRTAMGIGQQSRFDFR